MFSATKKRQLDWNRPRSTRRYPCGGSMSSAKKRSNLPCLYVGQKYSLDRSLLDILDKAMDPSVSKQSLDAVAALFKKKEHLGKRTSFSQSSINHPYAIPESHEKFIQSSMEFLNRICEKEHHPEGFWDQIVEANHEWVNSSALGYRKVVGREIKVGRIECKTFGKYHQFPFDNPNKKPNPSLEVEYYDDEPNEIDLDVYMKDNDCECNVCVCC